MRTLEIYSANVLIIATALALLEIWLERFRSGFGGDFYSPFWSTHCQGGVIEWLKKVAGKEYINRYHATMFGLILPLIYLGEYVVLVFYGRYAWISSALYLSSVLIGVMVAEDFLYFLLIGFFAKRLLRGKGFDEGILLLLQGKIKWHTDYKEIAWGLGFPVSYYKGVLIATILLIAEYFIKHLGL
jgi:hypothetical protein